jgi:hypothetical protein
MAEFLGRHRSDIVVKSWDAAHEGMRPLKSEALYQGTTFSRAVKPTKKSGL